MKLTTLDKAFSEFIRMRDRIEGTEYVRCISCGKVVLWKESDCGHYVNRKHMSTRWDEKNCSAQCRACNRYSEGNVSGYTLGLIQKYGKDIIELLHAKKMQTKKHSEFEIEQLTKYYKYQAKKLK